MMYLFIALGGALGAVGRYALMSLVGHVYPGEFPFGTLLVNALGSFLMGLLVELLTHFGEVSLEVRAFFTVGILGAFTTFSTFSLDAVLLYQRGETFYAALYIIASVVVCIAALFTGLAAFRWILQ